MMELVFVKLQILQCTDCNSTVKRLHLRFFLEYVPNTSFLKKDILRKKVYGGLEF